MSEPHPEATALPEAIDGAVMDAIPQEQVGVNVWLDIEQFPDHLKKYWHQRYQIWDRYDEGICMTADSWYGVTPEPIANKIATHLAESTPDEKTWIIDTFAGVGGNAIAFALSGRWEKVFAIEKDPLTLKCAKHNAKIYGVDKKITWINGNSFEVLKKRFGDVKNALVFGSPPWGGTEYNAENVFDLSKMEPYSLDDLYESYSKISSHIVLYLPRSSDLYQIAKLAPEDKKLEVAHYCLKGASKALCVYIGDFDFAAEEVEGEE